MEIPLILPSNQPKTPWDEDVPILEVPGGYKVYLTNPIFNPDSYNQLCYTLDLAKPHETVEFIINTPGGDADSAFMVYHAVQSTKAKTVATLVGTVASAGTIIAMACKTINVSPNLGFMIHIFSAAYSGKAQDLKSVQDFNDKEMTAYFRDIYKDFLTVPELDKVIEGKDLWMGSSEVKQRWANKQAAKKVKKETADE